MVGGEWGSGRQTQTGVGVEFARPERAKASERKILRGVPWCLLAFVGGGGGTLVVLSYYPLTVIIGGGRPRGDRRGAGTAGTAAYQVFGVTAQGAQR